MSKQPAEPATGNFWESPIEPVYHNIRKNLKGHPHADFLEVYIGLGAIIAFLFLASLAPQIGEKLGLVSLRKEGQQSFASQEEYDIKMLTDSLLAEYANYEAVVGDVQTQPEQPPPQPESPSPETTQSAQPLTTPSPESFPSPQQDQTATSESQVQGEKTKKDKKEKKEDIEKRMADISQKRKEKLLSVIEKRPDLILQYKIPKDIRSKLSSSVQPNIEEEIDYVGKFENIIEEDFTNQKSKDYYFLIYSNKRLSLHTTDPFSAPLSGSKVRVTGVKLDDKIAFSTKNTVEVLEEATPDTIGEQKTIVLLVNFQNTAQPALTKEQVGNFVNGRLADFYTENSYSKMNIAADVLGWYQIPVNRPCSNSLQVRSEAIAAAESGVFFPNYSRLLIFVPSLCSDVSSSALGLSSIGKITINSADGLVEMSFALITSSNATNLGVVGHEFGHGLGSQHASFLDCGAQTIASSGCSVIEYGDAYDIMGGAPLPGHWINHFNAPHKELMGWFSSANVGTITASGTYVLEPIETAASNLKVLKIQRAPDDFLYIEYRQPIGFDTISASNPTTDIFQGALVHSLYTFVSGKSLLLDISPTTESEVNYVALAQGATFTDPATATVVSVASKDPVAITLNVQIGKTDFVPPIASLNSPSEGNAVFDNVTVGANASDDSGIDKVEFYYLPQPVGMAHLIGTDSLAPYTISWDTRQVANGSYRLYVRAFDKSGTSFNVANNSNLSNKILVTVNNADSDNDSFKDAVESYIGTDPNRACSATAAANDEPVDAWPPDFNDDRKANIVDVLFFGDKMNKNNPSLKRYDFDMNGTINIIDVQYMSPYMSKSCTP